MYLPNSKFSFNFKKIKSEKNTEPGLFRLKLSMFFPFQFFWACSADSGLEFWIFRVWNRKKFKIVVYDNHFQILL